PKKLLIEEIYYDAIKKNGTLIKLINNPSEEICFDAIKNDPNSINFIKNPTDEMYLIASKEKPYLLTKIKDKSKIVEEDDLCGFIEINSDYINKIKNPSE